MTLRFIKNSKLSDELLLDGYIFQRKTSKPNQPIIWRCREYRVFQDRCPAACKTENGQLIKQSGAHNHQAPRNASIEMKDAVANMKIPRKIERRRYTHATNFQSRIFKKN